MELELDVELCQEVTQWLQDTGQACVLVEDFSNACHHSGQTSKTRNYAKNIAEVRAALSRFFARHRRLWHFVTGTRSSALSAASLISAS